MDKVSVMIGKSRSGKAYVNVSSAVMAVLKGPVKFSNGEAFLCVEGGGDSKAWKTNNEKFPYQFNVRRALSGSWPVFKLQQVKAYVDNAGRLLIEKPNVDLVPDKRTTKRHTRAVTGGEPYRDERLTRLQDAVNFLNDLEQRKEIEMSVRSGRLRVKVTTVIG